MAFDLLIDHVPLQVSWIYERYDLCVDTFIKSCNTYFRKIYRSFFQKYKNIYTKWQEMFLYHILSYCLLCKTLNFVDLIICKTYKLLWSMNWWWQDDTSNKKLLLDNLCFDEQENRRRQQQRQQQSSSGTGRSFDRPNAKSSVNVQDDREGVLNHPKRGRIRTYMFQVCVTQLQRKNMELRRL